jgi:hypothetical protein
LKQFADRPSHYQCTDAVIDSFASQCPENWVFGF